MASQRWAGLVLLAPLILVLCWTTITARSLDNTPDVPSLKYKVKRQVPDRTREEVQASTEVVKNSLTVIKEVMENIPADKVKDVMKSFSKIASLAPGIGTLVASVLDMVLAFIPQEDPVLNEVKTGFAVVNQKLDALSIQIGNLKTDVKWYNYASVYSRDESNILNAWDKFNELRQNGNSPSKEERVTLADTFKRFYESSGAESSVLNLHRYLTVSSGGLNENLISLLKDKFKCDISKIGKYNLYFSSLLWKGMVLNQFYWKLLGLSTTAKEAEHVTMFQKVLEAQLAAIDNCMQTSETTMKTDVVEIATGLSADDKKAVALTVKTFLDEKYNWYNWVVVVYGKADKTNHIVKDATEIEVGELIVLVNHTPHAELIDVPYVQRTATKCFSDQYCQSIKPDECQASYFPENWGGESTSFRIVFNEYAKILHVSYDDTFAEVPTPLHHVQCSWYPGGGKVYMHFSRKTPVCTNNPCQNNGQCERILDSNEWLCRCPSGFYGEHCEQRIGTEAAA